MNVISDKSLCLSFLGFVVVWALWHISVVTIVQHWECHMHMYMFLATCCPFPVDYHHQSMLFFLWLYAVRTGNVSLGMLELKEDLFVSGQM